MFVCFSFSSFLLLVKQNVMNKAKMNKSIDTKNENAPYESSVKSE